MMKSSLIGASALSLLLAQSVVYAENAVNFSGVVEIEVAQETDAAGDTVSDIAVATVELGLEAQINKALNAAVVLLHEEDDTALEVDVATVTYAPQEASWSLTAGQMYLPFGAFETGLVSDPLTLEIAEIRESAVQLDIESGALTTSFYLFNGDDKENKQSDDVIDNFGFKFSYRYEGNVNVTAGVSYLNDMGNTDGLQNDAEAGATDEYVAGTALDLMIEYGNLNIIVEHIAASDAFETNELGAGDSSQPSATNVELDYQSTISDKPATFAIAQQMTDEAAVLGLLETKTMLGVSVEVMKNTSLAFELSSSKDYAGDTAESIVAQLAVEF